MSNFLDLIEENFNTVKKDLEYLRAQGNTIHEFCLEGKLAYKKYIKTPEYAKLKKLSAKMKKLTFAIDSLTHNNFTER